MAFLGMWKILFSRMTGRFLQGRRSERQNYTILADVLLLFTRGQGGVGRWGAGLGGDEVNTKSSHAILFSAPAARLLFFVDCVAVEETPKVPRMWKKFSKKFDFFENLSRGYRKVWEKIWKFSRNLTKTTIK